MSRPPINHIYNFADGQHCIRCVFAPPERANNITLLILHGLGDSSANYDAFFNDEDLKNFNILIPDALGHGQSQCTGYDYSFDNNFSVLEAHLEKIALEKNIKSQKIIIIGHSLGGDMGVLLCGRNSKLKQNIVGFINVEGSLTEHDTFISKFASARENI